MLRSGWNLREVGVRDVALARIFEQDKAVARLLAQQFDSSLSAKAASGVPSCRGLFR